MNRYLLQALGIVGLVAALLIGLQHLARAGRAPTLSELLSMPVGALLPGAKPPSEPEPVVAAEAVELGTAPSDVELPERIANEPGSSTAVLEGAAATDDPHPRARVTLRSDVISDTEEAAPPATDIADPGTAEPTEAAGQPSAPEEGTDFGRPVGRGRRRHARSAGRAGRDRTGRTSASGDAQPRRRGGPRVPWGRRRRDDPPGPALRCASRSGGHRPGAAVRRAWSRGPARALESRHSAESVRGS